MGNYKKHDRDSLRHAANKKRGEKARSQQKASARISGRDDGTEYCSVERNGYRKVRYRTKKKAIVVLSRIKGLPQYGERRAGVYGSRRAEAKVYQCPHCDGWHLTSQK